MSMKICKLLPSLSSPQDNPLVLVRTDNEFTFQQDIMTSWSGEVGVGEVYCMHYALRGVGVCGGVVRGTYLYWYIINTIITNITTNLQLKIQIVLSTSLA